MSTRSSPRRLARIPFFVAGLALLLAGCGVNNIPSYEESAKADWSQVLNQYQRRADLIPNLVETVKGYAAQERQVLEEVTNARARATQAQLQIPPDIINNPEAFKRFQDAMKTIISVPHDVIQKRIEEHRKAAAKNPNRRGPKPKTQR